MEEVLAAVVVGGGKIDNTRAAAEAGGGSGNKKMVVEGAKNKRIKTVRVRQGFIDSLLQNYPFRPFPGEPQELDKNIEDPVVREQLRLALAPATAIMKENRDKEEAIIKQYLAQGYAEEEVEVDGDDDE